MTPRAHQEKLFKKEYAKELFSIAKGDLASAQALAKSKAGRSENVCYLAQQSIEKALKAVLCHRGIAVPFVHDLGALVAKIPHSLAIPFGYELNDLNEFAGVRRYEEGKMEIDAADVKEVLKRAKEIIAWTQKCLKK